MSPVEHHLSSNRGNNDRSLNLEDDSMESDEGFDDGNSSMSQVVTDTTCIVFDYDDTLCCSSWIDRLKLMQRVGNSPLPEDVLEHFANLEEAALAVLKVAAEYGSVIVITNAESGWVEHSSERFMPRLHEYLQGLRVVSARSTYEKYYPAAPLCWKAAAFAHEANQIFGADSAPPSPSDSPRASSGVGARGAGAERTIISIGDSNEERIAVKIAAKQLGAIAKSVKLLELPDPGQLTTQLSALVERLDAVVRSANGDLDLISVEDNAHHSGIDFIIEAGGPGGGGVSFCPGTGSGGKTAPQRSQTMMRDAATH